MDKPINNLKNNKNHIKIPKWLIAAILYGLSWSMFAEINLSFLAWFAYVPLFLSLENKNTFWSFYKQALLFSIVAYIIICHGFLLTPQKNILVIGGATVELIMSSVAFALWYPFKKKFGLDKSLWIFPFIIALWEWIYQHLDFTFGYLMLSHSQSQNIWLIQFIDIFGVWSIASWVMIFNVLIYFQYKKFNNSIFNKFFLKKVLLISAVMVVPSVIYSIVKNFQIENLSKKQIDITLINTNFGLLSIKNYDDYLTKIERLTYITDSADYSFKQIGHKTDLYVWHEGAVDFGNDSIFYDFIGKAVNDWKAPLLTGMQIIPYNAPETDQRKVNRATLIQSEISQSNFQYYDKMNLAPGREKIPYRAWLEKNLGIPFKINYYKPGEKLRLIEWITANNQKVKIGTPICMEQNYPEIWCDMTNLGAECFVQLSYEAWWTTDYFKKQMANITRLRCIENRKSAGRVSNGGLTAFYDSFGRIVSQSNTEEGSLTFKIYLNNHKTVFSQFQYNFPILCGLAIIIFFIFHVKPKFNTSLKLTNLGS